MTFEDSIHKVTLSGSEISSILYALEGWIQANDEYNEGGDLSLDIDNVFTALEEVADSWQGEFADPKVLDREDIVVDTFTEDDYKDKVDTLVDKMKGVNDNYYRIDGY
jgi:hypothetical protein